MATMTNEAPMRAEGGQMMGSHPAIDRLRDIVTPIVDDLGLDLYDLEQRGGTFRVTVDTRPGSERGIDLDELALVTRSISRELDHVDPIPGRYTLEVTSPGVERTLRTPEHFAREIGKTVSVRLRDPDAAERRLNGLLVGADGDTATIRVGIGDDGSPDDRVVRLDGIDRARTVFEWGPSPKPGGPRKGSKPSRNRTQDAGTGSSGEESLGRDSQHITPSTTEETP
ncbi:MAG: ribosome maturation factor RimP [Actinobacteria bacterium]|jgi:ribosome maturation factor RimP|nr:ribosome maturation factor RimP [Actinomycetota bacterium]